MHPRFQPMVALAIEAVRKALVVDNFTESPEALRLGTHQVVLYCNAGRHRSVAAALELASKFRIIGWQVVVSHYEWDTWNASCRKGECLSCGEQPRDVWGSLPFLSQGFPRFRSFYRIRSFINRSVGGHDKNYIDCPGLW